MRFAPAFLSDRARDGAAAAIVAGLLAAIVGVAWQTSLRSGASPSSAIGTVRRMREAWPADSRTAGIVRLPFAEFEVETPGGRIISVRGDIRLMQRCRLGGAIRLVGMPTNDGSMSWSLTRDPCD